jgi:hypothetical protein
VPSSLIFASLVVVWLLILVPAAARRRQEVARPSVAALSGRVLERASAPQRRRTQEVDVVHDGDEAPARGGGVDVDERADEPINERADDDIDEPVDEPSEVRERPRARYRPGRGGFDPEAAAMAARERYAFRQRVVLLLLLGAIASAVVAVAVVPGLWWPHAAIDALLVGYLVYRRRQVRMEEAIRERRAARLASSRRPRKVPEPQVDDRAEADEEAECSQPSVVEDDEPAPTAPIIPAQTTAEPAPALPRLRPAPPPPLPPGTRLVEADDEDPALHDLDAPGGRRDYRRAAGQ